MKAAVEIKNYRMSLVTNAICFIERITTLVARRPPPSSSVSEDLRDRLIAELNRQTTPKTKDQGDDMSFIKCLPGADPFRIFLERHKYPTCDHGTAAPACGRCMVKARHKAGQTEATT